MSKADFDEGLAELCKAGSHACDGRLHEKDAGEYK
nr:MAG TPA: hypothetical protein [Caudoviricetes sp.]